MSINSVVHSGSVEKPGVLDPESVSKLAVHVLKWRYEVVAPPVSVLVAQSALEGAAVTAEEHEVAVEHGLAFTLEAALGQLGITDVIVVDESTMMARKSLAEAQELLITAAAGSIDAKFKLEMLTQQIAA